MREFTWPRFFIALVLGVAFLFAIVGPFVARVGHVRQDIGIALGLGVGAVLMLFPIVARFRAPPFHAGWSATAGAAWFMLLPWLLPVSTPWVGIVGFVIVQGVLLADMRAEMILLLEAGALIHVTMALATQVSYEYEPTLAAMVITLATLFGVWILGTPSRGRQIVAWLLLAGSVTSVALGAIAVGHDAATWALAWLVASAGLTWLWSEAAFGRLRDRHIDLLATVEARLQSRM